MEEMYSKLLDFFDKEDKESAVQYALSLLEEHKINVFDLYNNYLQPIMYAIDCKLDNPNMCIWMEHVRSSIVRTIIEAAYPYVLKERDKNGYKLNKKIIVFCPAEEQHEIGARMVTDYFTMNGYDATFVGANTPKEEFVYAIEYLKPDYIAISVSNFYNLVNAKHIIEYIKAHVQYDLKILVGGQVFNHTKVEEIGANRVINTYEDIVALRKEVENDEASV